MGEENCLPSVEESTEPPIPHRQRNRNGRLTGPPSSLTVAHTLTAEKVAEELGVDTEYGSLSEIDTKSLTVHSKGLSAAEAESRLQVYGPNKIKGAERLSLWAILLRQVSNSLTLVLVITMGLSFGINDFIEGGVVSAVIILNIIVGFLQDYKAEKTIQSLKNLTAPESNVLRDGTLERIRAVDLVPGDIVHLNVGSIVPADLRLIDGMNAYTDEAFLTGESLPVEKTPSTTFHDEDLPTGDQTNLAFSGSKMQSGRCTGIVFATGMQTEVGKIAHMLRHKDDTPEDSVLYVKVKTKIVKGVKVVLGLTGTPLQISLSKFALLLFALAILLAIIVFSANKWEVQRGEVVIYGICVAVAVIPESLIAVLTITIAVGAKAMARSNVIIRVSSAIEAVGCVTNICSDKTGTLTQGRMVTRKAVIPGVGTLTVCDTTDPYNPGSGHVELNGQRLNLDEYSGSALLERFLRTIALCNLSTVEPALDVSSVEGDMSKNKGAVEHTDEELDTEASTQHSRTNTRPTSTLSQARSALPVVWKATGEPTEIALHVLALRFGMGRSFLLQDSKLKHAAEFPFDSTVKKMTVVYETPSKYYDIYTKGATEFLLPVLNIPVSEKTSILEAAEAMAADGLRVLCIAHKTLPLGTDLTERKNIENELNYIGLVAIYDPPRAETKGAVRDCQVAGITVHMLTGDHPGTAMAIAHEVGILNEVVPNTNAGTAVMLARDFDHLSDEEIDRMETLPLVLARCSPATKVKMVDALHRRKLFCVMTGDGVNDSPALVKSNVGMAMGTGSDVAKDAAEMILTDDNFASIVKAVEEGRRLFDNIQKFLLHLLISNIAQVILLLIGLAFKDMDGHSVFPLSPLEILWVNLITSSFLAIGLGLEESQPDSMFHPPHDLSVGVFTKELIVDKFIYGFFMGSLCLASFAIVAYAGPNGGNLGSGCNDGYNDSCAVVFRARATTYATITLLLLVTAWEVKHFSRSLFNLYPESSTMRPGLSVFSAVWRNRFLFWAVMAGFCIMFPVIYLPVIGRDVFKHGAIGWEWGISLGCVFVYVAAIESWKAIKRSLGLWSGNTQVLMSLEDAEKRAGLGIGRVREKGSGTT